MPALSVSPRAAHDAQVEALVLFSRPVEGGGVELALARSLPPKAVRHLIEGLVALRAKGVADEVVSLTHVPGIAAPLVVVTGLGKVGPQRAEAVRRAAGAAVRALAGRPSVAVLAPAADAVSVAAAAEGAAYGGYAFLAHRSRRGEPPTEPVATVTVHGAAPRDKAAPAAVARAEVLARQVSWARDLVNTAPNALSPEAFAQAVAQRAGETVSVSVLDETQLAEAGCGGLIGVGMGSANPPRLVVVRYHPPAATRAVALVGKGITFDSGGLCLKPTASMAAMKSDMAGAAAVAAAVFAIAELELPVSVTGWLALAENMPSATAQRPGDVVTMPNGATVEIVNTDAEGRLVLADAVCLASETGPDAILDVATLTGAAITALGHRTAALLANDDGLQGEVAMSASEAGETVWPMPIAEEVRSGMDSTVADLKHTGDSVGGLMIGAAFVREFVGPGVDDKPIPWAHLDIAGPSWNDGSPHGYTPKGGTGYGVRTLVRFVERRS